MNQQDFVRLLEDLEVMVIESFLWPVGLIIDPKFLEQAFEHGKWIVQYKLPSTGEVVPVYHGKPGEFRLKTSDLTDSSVI